MATNEETIFPSDKRWRFQIERHSGLEPVIRLPFRFGISFWAPWWQLMLGVARNDIGVEWDFLCFSGEIWRDAPREEREAIWKDIEKLPAPTEESYATG